MAVTVGAPTDPVQQDPLPPGPLTLIIVHNGTTRRVELPHRGRLRIGRDPAADVCLEDTSASRFHAELQIAQRVFVRDLDSRNGTRLGGVRLAPNTPKEICRGQPIELGSTVLLLHPSEHVQDLDLRSLVGRSRATPMRRARDLCRHAASADANVVLVGETGTGKTTLAKMIHRFSSRREGPLQIVDGGSLRSDTVAALFDDRGPLFRSRGTLLLRQLEAFPFDVQQRLAALAERRGDGPGIRLMATCLQEPATLVAAGSVRPELRFRLEQVLVSVPPLRERLDELEVLARDALTEACESLGVDPPELTEPLLEHMRAYSWPGNLRELHNRIAQAVALRTEGPLGPEHLVLQAADGDAPQADSSERERIIQALSQCAGNQSQAAKLLGISRRTLSSRLDRYHIPRPRKR